MAPKSLARQVRPLRPWIAVLAVLLATLADPPAPLAQQAEVIGSLTRADGLTDERVFGILQDSRGFMWFATRSGLNRYDGYEIRQFLHDPENPHSLADNVVEIILEDASGDIWIGMNQGGLDRFDRLTERFVHYPHDPEDPGTISGHLVQRLFQDSRGRLWVGTNDGGASVIDPNTGQVTRFRHDPTAPAGSVPVSVLGFREDRSGAIWIATSQGLHRFEPSTGKIDRFVHDPSDPNSLSNDLVWMSLIDSRGVLWLATEAGLSALDSDVGRFTRYQNDPTDPHSLSHDGVLGLHEDSTGAIWVGTRLGIDRLDPETGRFDRFALATAEPIRFGGVDIIDIHEDRGGSVWVGARSGLYRFDRSTEQFIPFFHVPTDPSSLSDNRVRDIYEDTSGVLWVGTVHGVNRIASTPFVHFAPQPTRPTGLSHGDVSALLEDRAGNVWVGLMGGFLNRLDRATGDFSRYDLRLDRPTNDEARSIWAIHEDEQGILWLGTTDGLVRFNPSDGAMRKFRIGAPESNQGQVRAIHQLNETLLIGATRGVWTFDRRTETFAPYTAGQEGTSLSTLSAVSAFATDRYGLLWMATMDGLTSVDLGSGETAHYGTDPDDPRSLSPGSVYAVYPEPGGAVWVATEGGLDRLDRDNGEFTHFVEPDGPPDRGVYGILEADDGVLWLPTRNGLLRLDRQTGEFTRQGPQAGPSSDFNLASSHKGPSGAFYFGSIEGFTRLRPDLIEQGTGPPLVITGLEVARRPVPIGNDSILRRSITETDEITLAHTDRIVSFEFAALSYAAPELHRYRYRLEGFEEGWTEVGADDRLATYMDLPAGDYTFRVIGSDHQGVWNELGASVRITVEPPWWMEPWALTLSVLVTMVLAFSGHGLRTRALKRRNVELQHEIAARERAESERAEAEEARRRVEEKLDHRRAELAHAARVTTMGDMAVSLAHELNQPLTAIVANAQAGHRLLTASTPDTEEVEGALIDIADEGRRAAEVIRRLREFLTRGESGAEPLDVNELVTDAAHLLESDARRRGLSITLAPGDDLPQVLGDHVQLQQVLVNLVINGLDAMGEIEHARRENLELTIRTFRMPGDSVEIAVEDAGPGIDATALDSLFEPFFTTKPQGMGMGLSISKSIVEAHGGRLWVTENDRCGVTFHFTVPTAE